jgi:transketolase
MAVSEKHMAAVFNRPDFNIIDHYTYCFVGDGCLMEGISHEVCSFAGVLKLNKLIVIYDDNHISIDGDVGGWSRDNTPERFKAYGWNVIADVDGHNSDAVREALTSARMEKEKPTIICCKTTIGWGSPALAGSAATHGAPLGEKEVAAVRGELGWEYPPFVIPEEIYDSWNACDKGNELEAKWKHLFTEYQEQYPDLAQELLRRVSGKLPSDWQQQADDLLNDLNTKQQSIATRKASQQCLDVYANVLPEMFGGSADLTESNCTNWKGMQVFTADHPEGRYLHYGVREFGMSAMMNGMALYKGMLPFGGTFLTFSDYARNAIRLSSIMRQRVVYVYTHDSIGLGEDGPTHQPIEQLPGLRMMPNLSVWRPCDTVETAVAWRSAVEHHGPTCLLLSRQNLPFQMRTPEQLTRIQRGGYVLADYAQGKHPMAILIGTGSEVALVMDAAKALAAEGIMTRVVSMPSVNVFLQQPEAYQQDVLPDSVTSRIVVEAATGDDWYRFVGMHGKVMGIKRFGASAPAKDVYRDCGLTVDQVVLQSKELIYAAANEAHHLQHKCASGEIR